MKFESLNENGREFFEAKRVNFFRYGIAYRIRDN